MAPAVKRVEGVQHGFLILFTGLGGRLLLDWQFFKDANDFRLLVALTGEVRNQSAQRNGWLRRPQSGMYAFVRTHGRFLRTNLQRQWIVHNPRVAARAA
jgi:hypothetical protein